MIIRNNSIYYVLWICFVVTTPCVLGGITLGFSSIALPKMNLNLNASSWFSSLFTFAAPFGAIMTSYIIDKYGRKPTLIMCIIPSAIGWLLIWKNEENLSLLFIGRFLTGFASGATFFPAQVYLVEYIDLNPSLVHLRTSFANCIPTATFFGYVLVFLMGTFFSYEIVALMAFIYALYALCCMLACIPESPAWLYEKGRYGDAEWAQKRLNLPCLVEPSLINGKEGYRKEEIGILNKLIRREVYIPMIITSIAWALIMLSGCSVFSAYMVDIINKNDSYSLQQSLYLGLISAIICFISNIIQIFVVTVTGVRKILIFTSIAIACVISAYGIISDCFVDEASEFTDLYDNLVIATLWILTFLQGFGFVTIPRAILGELFPIDAKKFAVVPTIISYVVQGITIKLHPYLVLYLGGILYVIYGMFSLLLSVFFFYFLPETVGKTMVQINQEFRRKRIPL